jgi:gas vesicle protein
MLRANKQTKTFSHTFDVDIIAQQTRGLPLFGITFLQFLDSFSKKYKAMSNTGKIALGIAGAAAIGTLLGLLVAPEKGSEFQKNISKRGSQVINQLIDYVLRRQKSLTSGSSGSTSKKSSSHRATAKSKK